MTEAEARAEIESRVAWESAPALTSAEVTRLVRSARRVDRYGTGTDTYDEWSASHAYAVGDLLVPTVRNGRYYRVTATDGSSGAAEPAWPTTSGGTVTVDGVTYTEAGTDPWEPTYDLNAAAAEGWRWKAGKVATDFSFSTDGQSFNRNEMREACLEMARTFAHRVAGSVPLVDDTAATDIAGNVNA